MTTHFEVIRQPGQIHLAPIESQKWYSPFDTSAYAAARAELGMIPYLFAVKEGSKLIAGCLGFLQRGVLAQRLEIVSAPRVSCPSLFWNGVFDFCRSKGVWDLDIETYASDVADIPARPGELKRIARTEWILDLEVPDLTERFSGDHRRNIKRAVNAGLVVNRTRDPRASREHLELIQASMARHQARGEDVEIPDSTRYYEAILRSGAAELFQARDRENLLSSMMVVRSKYSAYDQSSGTSPEGLKLGASRYLVAQVAEILKREGLRQFNLGGANEDEPGLREFKAGFGARVIASEAVSFSTASPLKQKLRFAARLICQATRGGLKTGLLLANPLIWDDFSLLVDLSIFA